MAARSGEREKQAERELGHTDVGRGLTGALAASFLATILAVPAVQLVLAPPDPRPLAAGVPDACALHRFERGLEDESVFGRWLLPRLQAVLTGWLGVGNEQVYLGGGGRLYHRPGVDYVSGPGFLEPDVLAARRREGRACEAAPQPDPVAALAGFGEELAARGIRLVAVPTPGKSVAAPGALARGDVAAPLQNPSFARFVADLEARGVAVFDPTSLLVGADSYLSTDTHWRPEAMARAAAALARRLVEGGHVAPHGGAPYERLPQETRHFGDLVLLLHLPADQALYPPESVTLAQVREDGRARRPSRGAEVLLLGDSFSNIYSDPAAFRSERVGSAFGWGEAGGFAEQLSFALGRPVDRIVRNAGGAHAARAELARQVARAAEQGRDRLAGVRVVVWQFAMRELSSGDWKEIPLAAAPASAQPSPVGPAAVGPRTIRATVAARAEPPRPGSVPYRDALIAFHLRDVETEGGEPLPRELLVYAFGLRDDRTAPAARIAPGTRVAFRLDPFDDEAVQARVGSLNRVELDDLALLALPAYFGELPAPGGSP